MEETKKHSIYLSERKEVIIEGVLKLDSFDKSEFLIDTTKGFLHIQGKDLSLGNMDTEKQTLTIEGIINIMFFGKAKGNYAICSLKL